MRMEFVIAAKPIEWEESSEGRQWGERRYGFCISHDPLDPANEQYFATWSEGPEDFFATLAEAQQWCQHTIDSWIRENVLVTPNAKVTGA